MNLIRPVGQAQERLGGEQRRPSSETRAGGVSLQNGAENWKSVQHKEKGFSCVMEEINLCADHKGPVKTGTLIMQRGGDPGRSQVLE